jgi:hypothetical protein
VTELNDDERSFVLAGLFELRITRIEDTFRCEAIDDLAEKRRGDRSQSSSAYALTRRTYVRYRGGMRCPIHGRQEPEDEQNPVCPVAIRRTTARNVDEAICGMALERER